ncbi:hypothetical protein ACTA71_011992 [Dictyostelium dimigraforme]
MAKKSNKEQSPKKTSPTSSQGSSATKKKTKTSEPVGTDIRNFFAVIKPSTDGEDIKNDIFSKAKVDCKRKEFSLSDKENDNEENVKKDIINDKKKPLENKSPSKKKEPSKSIDLSSDEDKESNDEDKKKSTKKKTSSTTNKKKPTLKRLKKKRDDSSSSDLDSDSEIDIESVDIKPKTIKKNLKRKSKPDSSSSSEDENKYQKDKKIKLKTPEKKVEEQKKPEKEIEEQKKPEKKVEEQKKSENSVEEPSVSPSQKKIVYSFEDSEDSDADKPIPPSKKPPTVVTTPTTKTFEKKKENIDIPPSPSKIKEGTTTTTTSTETKSPSKANKSTNIKTPPAEKKKTPQLEFELPIVSITAFDTKEYEKKKENNENKIKDKDSSPFDEMEICETKSKTITPNKSTVSSSSSTPTSTVTKNGKNNTSLNDELIFGNNEEDFAFSPIKMDKTTPSKSPKKETTPIKTRSKTNVESLFDDDSIFDSPDKKTTTTTTTTTSNNTKKTKTPPSKKEKFNHDIIFEENDTPLNRAIEDSIVKRSLSGLNNNTESKTTTTLSSSSSSSTTTAATASKKTQTPKSDPFDDDTEEDTEDEGEEPLYKQQSSSFGSGSINPNPTTPTKKPPSSSTNATPTKKPNPFMYMNGRPTPPNKGSKPRPQGKENCLRGKVFLVSGVMDSFERDEMHDIIKRWGGKVAKSAVKLLNYLISGKDVGEKKLEGAKKVGAKIISEDEFLEMINKTLPQKPTETTPTSLPTPSTTTESANITTGGIKGPSLPVKSGSGGIKGPSLPVKSASPPSTFTSASKMVSSSPPIATTTTTTTTSSPPISMASVIVPKSMAIIPKGHDMLWVEKYKPKAIEDLVGNPGIFQEFSKWLDQWHSTAPREASKKNAVLLSGPPGIGKTSAALLICKQKGFETIELNASDTRSKSEIERLLSGVSDNQNITKFFGTTNQDTGKDVPANKKIKTAIILDEIDGSSGNSDRGGIAEIISLIKKSKMPFICLCNDYYSPKVKSLRNHCLDLKLRKPTVTQVSSRLLAIAKHEGMKVSSYMIDKVYAASHSDIRQCINSLQMMARSKRDYNNDNISKGLEEKDFDLSPFTAAELILRDDNSNINKKLDYFFSDFSLVPLLIQENYLKTRPYGGGSQSKYNDCELFSMAADALSDSDQFGRAIGKEMAWNLLPTYGVTSCIIPSGYIRGSPPMPLAFPSYLGKYSNASKQQRFVRELQLHMRSTGNTFANRDETRLYYVPMLKHHLIQPLVQDGNDGIDNVINVMDEYGLTEEDRNNIIELSTWGKDDDPLKDIKTQVKSSFTRKFRSTAHAIYDVSLLSSKGSGGGGGTNIAEGYEEVEGESQNQIEEDDEEGEEKDSLPNLVKKSSVKSKSTSTTTTDTKSKSKSATTKSKKK